ncbi:hypothetical protein RirG_107360 [Rhizophagus irregularis DAOM 197198w]|uniref:Uncharacterized protein n=1 Tax=Rhizophagus irregularis (strain DAOM 197198w) TaxID=1432141 RepID=A0A015MN35_RHIIW|nr:hypothetical protein RirG_107360 [Rhizophagus irregularis DAOM 197198w]
MSTVGCMLLPLNEEVLRPLLLVFLVVVGPIQLHGYVFIVVNIKFILDYAVKDN